MAAKMAMLGNAQLSNNGEGFALPFPQIFQAAALQLINSVKVTAGSQALSYSFLQPSPAARPLILPSSTSESFPCPCSTAEAQRHQ